MSGGEGETTLSIRTIAGEDVPRKMLYLYSSGSGLGDHERIACSSPGSPLTFCGGIGVSVVIVLKTVSETSENTPYPNVPSPVI